ncbi:MAG: prephenate dehydratase, partial [Candidatus Marinimicrobia bacterium]|nr:prephenate dehydratase [Candidatus Neomarinimicrobiota bacterium]
IIEMFHIPIIQNLLGLVGTHLGDITEIHSHQQALRQCKDYLSQHFWTRPLIEDDDTAEAARRLSEGKLSSTSGVIANKACAELYGLEILQESIHDLKHNLTLFLGIKKLGD